MRASSSTKIPAGLHDDDAEPDSQILKFDTIMPTHDPSLDISSDPTSTHTPGPDTNYIRAVGETKSLGTEKENDNEHRKKR